MTRLFLKFLDLYQAILSPDHSFWAKRRFPYGYCRFHPSCSEYAKQALRQYGLIPGGIKAVGRILRCNPFAAGGYDPLK